MGGGLMQLVAYGAQDIYLTGNPQITFFKIVYRRHTNFSMECIKQSLKGTVGANSRVVATLARNGDLVHDCFLKFTNASVTSNGDENTNPGHQIINNIELEIGGQLIDKHYGHWMEAHAELTEVISGYGIQNGAFNEVQYAAANATTGFMSNYQITAGAGGMKFKDEKLKGATLYVPLRFWFCRHVGLSLPLIALQYHEVNINITTTNYYGVFTDPSLELWCNYIYLDTDERRRFAQVSHEYLIEQVQFQSFVQTSGPTNTYKLNFNHPVKELIWGSVENANAWGKKGAGAAVDEGGQFINIDGTTEPEFQLKLNGHDRFEKLPATYFTRYQPMKYHTSKGSGSNMDTLQVYSFALKPEEHQPSGTCNFSRIDNSQLICTGSISAGSNNTLFIYAVNYNVLRIMSGMGGLAYSN